MPFQILEFIVKSLVNGAAAIVDLGSHTLGQGPLSQVTLLVINTPEEGLTQVSQAASLVVWYSVKQ